MHKKINVDEKEVNIILDKLKSLCSANGILYKNISITYRDFEEGTEGGNKEFSLSCYYKQGKTMTNKRAVERSVGNDGLHTGR